MIGRLNYKGIRNVCGARRGCMQHEYAATKFSASLPTVWPDRGIKTSANESFC